jgi:hypothetical protein
MRILFNTCCFLGNRNVDAFSEIDFLPVFCEKNQLAAMVTLIRFRFGAAFLISTPTHEWKIIRV